VTADDLVDLELMLNRFLRLLGELTRGEFSRNTFQPWEIDIILDFRQCWLPPKRRTEILGQYERAVRRQMRSGPGPPMKLSEFLSWRDQRRQALKPAIPAAPPAGIVHPAPGG
jgi:hypothetical protein